MGRTPAAGGIAPAGERDMSRRPRNYMSLLVAVFTAGYAANAIRPPSPATALRAEQFLATPPPPNERYYLLLFGSQSTPRVARYTHSWGTVVKAVCLPGQAEPELEVHTISWMPAILDIHPLRFRVEPGVNLTLQRTLEYVLDNNERVSL